jgi:inositol transporter-like SP family MFS transporter
VGSNAQDGTSREQWRRTLLAAMANSIDAGSIVAGGGRAADLGQALRLRRLVRPVPRRLQLERDRRRARRLIGGRICDLLGRKKLYRWDLLLYAFGTLWIISAVREWTLLIGFFIVGLTVGADVPASWTLITETAPKEKRGRFAGLAQVLRCDLRETQEAPAGRRFTRVEERAPSRV